MPDHPAAKLCRPGTVPAGPVPGAPCGWIRCSRNRCQTAPAPISTGKDPPRLDQQPAAETKKARVNGLRRPPWLFFCPLPAPISTAAAPISTGKDRAAHGDDLPDLPGLGGVGPPDEQRTARPITCPACSFQPDPARRPDDPAALLPASLPDLPTTPARQHPAASPTPEGSDSPPNGIEL